MHLEGNGLHGNLLEVRDRVLYVSAFTFMSVASTAAINNQALYYSRADAPIFIEIPAVKTMYVPFLVHSHDSVVKI